MSKSWHSVNIEFCTSSKDSILTIFSGMNCIGLHELNDNQIQAFFDPDIITIAQLRHAIKQQCEDLPAQSITHISYDTQAYDDWTTKWRQDFTPIQILPDITIVPSWEDYSPSPNEHILSIDPGMAFGTGLHPTTQLCASLMHEQQSKQKINSILDIGCGSGILMMIAHLMNIPKINGVEIDLDSIAVAKENFAINHMPDYIIVSQLSTIKAKYSLVIANILLNILNTLHLEIMNCIADNGHLILSGITPDQVNTLISPYMSQFIIIDQYSKNDWSAILLQKK